jgi:hypothetical protein
MTNTPILALESFKIISSQGIIEYTPLIGGWGGIYISECMNYEKNNPPSAVFEGEISSNTEVTIRTLIDKGYNAFRIQFRSPLIGELYPDPQAWYEPWFSKSLNLAKAYNVWVIVDYHALYDSYQYTDQWISFWRDNIISKYKDTYNKIIWEPINEPVQKWDDGSHALKGSEAVTALAQQYQRWIDMARSLGDNHWLIVSAVCQWNNLPEVDWFPSVQDILGKVFLSKHFYYQYEYHENNWTIQDAEAEADREYSEVIIPAMAKYGKPFLCTEFGVAYGSMTPPDAINQDKSYAYRYSNVTLAYVKRLLGNFDLHEDRIGYMLFFAGDWSGGLYGAMKVWGDLLVYTKFNPTE